MHEGKESQPTGSGSWINIDAVDFVLILFHKLVSKYLELMSSSQLAIISPCRHQVKEFQEQFMETFRVESQKVVDITRDGNLRAWAGLFKAQAQARIIEIKPRPFKSPPNLDGPKSGRA